MTGVALVTGGGRGLGRSFALGLKQAGMSVAVCARTEPEIAESVALMGGGLAIPADVTDPEAVRRMIAQVESQLGPIELLVNNAGSGPPFGPTWEANQAQWWRTIEINLRGPMLCSHAVLPGMVARRRGRIINVASGAGTMAIPYMSAYVTSKAALIRFTEVLAAEVRPHGITVFAIQPGTVRTAMAEQLLASKEGEKWLPWFKQIFEQGRDETTEPGTNLVVRLASGAADDQSGAFLSVPFFGGPEFEEN